MQTACVPPLLSSTKEPAICSASQYLYQIKGTTPTLLQSNYTAGANIGG